MASKTTVSANDIINYLLRNVAPSWAGAGTLYLTLHTGAVGLAGNASTNEVSYTGYSRVAITRSSSGGFTAAASGQSSNNALLQFGVATAGSFPIVATHASITDAPSGASPVLVTAALTSSITINLNSNPQFPVGNVVVQEQ